MEKSVYKYLIKYSLPQQLWLTAMAVLSFPFLYAFYELPKRIINGAIQGDPGDFPVEIYGTYLSQTHFLLVLCGIFLGLVLINQSFKYYINVYRGLTGERMLRRLRYELFSRVLRFPQPVFKKKSQGEIIPMITSEVEPLGGFIGEAFSLPVFQGGTLLVILGFLFYQNWLMAAAAVALYPIQLYIIPRLQMRVNALGKERVRLVRNLSDRIGETVQGASEVHVHDTSQFVLSDFSYRLGSIFKIRYSIYRQKFVIKFINNFIQQLGPFFFYSLGGYLVINGSLDMGTLVAAIAAHKDLGGPWKELLSFYQRSEDAKIKYDQVVIQFDPPGMMQATMQSDEPEVLAPRIDSLGTGNLVLSDDVGENSVDGVSFELAMPSHVAIVGESGSGAADLAQLLSRVLVPTNGSVSIGGNDITAWPESITGRRLSYVGQQGFVFSGSVGFNLQYGLNHRPTQPFEYDEYLKTEQEWRESESLAAGNTTLDINANWADLHAAGADSAESLVAECLRALEMVGLDEEVYRLGLRGIIVPKESPEVVDAVLKARSSFRNRLKQDDELGELIEGFDRSSYNTNATIAENLFFGNIVGDEFDAERMAENPYVLEVLEKVGLTDKMLEMGYDMAVTMVEMFADIPPDHDLFQQYSFVSADELHDLQRWLTTFDRDGLQKIVGEQRSSLISLPFKLIPARHRLGLIDDEMQAKLMEAREVFGRNLPESMRNSIEFFDVESYAPNSSIQDNIIFGKVAYGWPEAANRMNALITEVVSDLKLRDTIIQVGLDYNVGVAGSRLTSTQRQKLVIARSILKRPDILFLSESTAVLDSGTQSLIMENLIKEFSDRGLVWVLQKPDFAEKFDYILVMKAGKVVEEGTFLDLNNDGSHFWSLLNAN